MAANANRTALVTGASSGIGLATAELLRANGFFVYAAARRVDRMERLRAAGTEIVSLDVTDPTSCKACIDRIVRDRGGVDILVNNAGYGSYGAIEDVPLDEARRQFEVNVFGLADLTKHVLPGMRERHFGKIVNISSMGGKIYTPFGGWYHAAKHALEAFSDCLRLEVGPMGIDVIVVEPGAIATEWGLIAADNLQANSEIGPYGSAATRTADRLRTAFKGNRLSPPLVVAETVLKAVTAERPRTRYATGFMATPAIFARRWLSDRMFDRLIRALI